MEGKFSVKVFANNGIIMLRSHSVPPSQPPLLLSSTSSLLPFLPVTSSFLTSLSLLCGLDLGSHLAQIPAYTPASLFLKPCLFSAASLFPLSLFLLLLIALPPPLPQTSRRPGAVLCCCKASLSAHPCNSHSDSHFRCRIARFTTRMHARAHTLFVCVCVCARMQWNQSSQQVCQAVRNFCIINNDTGSSCVNA